MPGKLMRAITPSGFEAFFKNSRLEFLPPDA